MVSNVKESNNTDYWITLPINLSLIKVKFLNFDIYSNDLKHFVDINLYNHYFQ